MKSIHLRMNTLVSLALALMLLTASEAQAQNDIVESVQEISTTTGGFTGTAEGRFGSNVEAIGDIDGDGIPDLAAGAPGTDDGGSSRGAVWILLLQADGTVRENYRISSSENTPLDFQVDDNDFFGFATAPVGDLDMNGTPDIAVGAAEDDDGANAAGAVYILFLDYDGAGQTLTVIDFQKISNNEGGLGNILGTGTNFGAVLENLDINGDGVSELVVGSGADDESGGNEGAVWVLFLNMDGTVQAYSKINDNTNTPPAFDLDPGDEFGSVASLGDLDGNGVPDLAVGANGDDDGGLNRGAIYILYLAFNASGPGVFVSSFQKISHGMPAGLMLENGDFLGARVSGVGDIDGNGTTDIAANFREDGGGVDRGAVKVLLLAYQGAQTVDVIDIRTIGEGEGGFTEPLFDGSNFGTGLASPGDIDGDNTPDLVAGDLGGGRKLWVLFLGGFNAPPIADAGTDQVVLALQNVVLDGSASSDPDEDPLTFDWSFLAKPPGSLATLSDPTAVNPTFTADLPGDYVLQLLVNDGTVDSSPDEVTITAQTVEEGTEDLLTAVDDLLAAGLINEKGAIKLDKHLEKALEELGKGKPDKSIKNLEKFIEEVEKQVDKGDLAEADGAVLIASAEALIAVLEGGAGKGGPALAGAVEGGIPEGYALSSAYPNPFNPVTTIAYALPEAGDVMLAVYDVMGRQVALLVHGSMRAGRHEATFDASGLPSGVYFYRIQAGSFIQARRMVLMK